MQEGYNSSKAIHSRIICVAEDGRLDLVTDAGLVGGMRCALLRDPPALWGRLAVGGRTAPTTSLSLQ